MSARNVGITQGKWTAEAPIDTETGRKYVGTEDAGDGRPWGGFACFVVLFSPSDEPDPGHPLSKQGEANLRLFLEAGEVSKATDLWPKQLEESRQQLLRALKRLRNYERNHRRNATDFDPKLESQVSLAIQEAEAR